MKKVISLILFFFLSIFNVYGDENQIDISTEEITNSSVFLKWTPLENYSNYIIKFGEKSIENEEYSFSSSYLTDSFLKEGLTPSTTYYFSLYGYDDFGEEYSLSDELIINTKEDKQGLFVLLNSKNIASNYIELEFSNELKTGEGVERNFSIDNMSDNFELINVVDTKAKGKTLQLELDVDLKIGTKYLVTVLVLEDVDGESIEYGIESESEFEAKKIVVEEEIIKEELNSANEEPVEEEKVIEDESGNTGKDITEEEIIKEELNSANEELVEEEIIEDESGNTGKDITEEDVNNNIISAAKNTDKLPSTGPEQILFLILSFIFVGLFFVIRFKRV